MAIRTLVGGSALSYNGLVAFYPGLFFQTTGNDAFDGWNIKGCIPYYLPEVDNRDGDIRQLAKTEYSTVRIPTPERAIMDYIQNLDRFELGFLYDGIEEYGRQNKQDWSKLEALAEKYGLLDELHYHIEEAYATNSNGE